MESKFSTYLTGFRENHNTQNSLLDDWILERLNKQWIKSRSNNNWTYLKHLTVLTMDRFLQNLKHVVKIITQSLL